MTHNPYFYIAVMALVSYAIRVLPLTLIRKPIKNQFIQSFLLLCSIYYVIRHDFSCDHRSNTKSCCRCYRTRFWDDQCIVWRKSVSSICRLLYGCIDPGINSCIEMFFCPFPCFSPFFLVIPIFS